MMLPTAYQDSRYELGLSPSTCEARVDGAGVIVDADATGNRSPHYRTAGIGRGGYAP